MNTLFAVDPGINGCGCAIFEKGKLAKCSYVKNIADKKDTPAVRILGMVEAVTRYVRGCDYLVLELPQVYQGGKQKGDPNDLIVLAAVVGGVARSLFGADTKFFRPSEWKGQIPPNVCARRILDRLDDDEKRCFENYAKFVIDLNFAERLGKEIGGTDHNTVDAIGIGLKALARFEPRRGS